MAARVSGISIMIMKENGHLVRVVDDDKDVEDEDYMMMVTWQRSKQCWQNVWKQGRTLGETNVPLHT